jgi:hypothetical protein
MKELNHLMTFEAFTNEEFNPMKKAEWKKLGTNVRKGVGFLTDEEKIEKGKEYVFNHPRRKQAYELFLNGGERNGKYIKPDPYKAEQYLKFWAEVEGEINATPVWNGKKFVDKSIYTSSSGSMY